MWASLQEDSYRKGTTLHNVFKMKYLEVRHLTCNLQVEQFGGIEHIRFSKNEKWLVALSKDFSVSIWEVGSWELRHSFRAYHQADMHFYQREMTPEQICEEFDVAVVALNNDASTLVCGLYNGVLQFWDVDKQELFFEIPSHLAEVTALEYNGDCSILVSSGADYLINVWNARSSQLLFEIRE